ncbi:MAG: hypothetical protein LC785_03060 [Acidobacteria bacterium]|nr:hypothetical protein [Acidobacteriota bacterium]
MRDGRDAGDAAPPPRASLTPPPATCDRSARAPAVAPPGGGDCSRSRRRFLRSVATSRISWYLSSGSFSRHLRTMRWSSAGACRLGSPSGGGAS